MGQTCNKVESVRFKRCVRIEGMREDEDDFNILTWEFQLMSDVHQDMKFSTLFTA